ncbi:transporter substrate-binding domain-containing protein [Serratia ureilytica]
MGDAVCAAAQLQCSWVETSFDSLIPALKARRFDAINSAMNVTEQRRRAIAFTDAIYQVPNRLIARPAAALCQERQIAGGQTRGRAARSIRRFTPKPIGRRQRGRGVLSGSKRVYLDRRPVGLTPRW